VAATSHSTVSYTMSLVGGSYSAAVSETFDDAESCMVKGVSVNYLFRGYSIKESGFGFGESCLIRSLKFMPNPFGHPARTK